MGSQSDEVKRHIEEKRGELGARLNELEYRVKSAADWHVQVRRHPWKAAAGAFAAGMLLAYVI